MSKTKVSQCFDANGKILFDPYRSRTGDPRYNVLFAGEKDIYSLPDCLTQEARVALKELIDENKWEWTCDAVALLHADRLGRNTSGYPTIYLFK